MDCNKINCMKCKFGGQSDGCHFDEESYNQALEDMENRYREWLKSEYGKVADDDMLTIRVLRSLTKYKFWNQEYKESKEV